MTRPSPAPRPSDEDLLRRHVAGDADAFGELVARHQDRLWAVALRTLGDQHDAADALQDAMINAFRRAGSFRSESAVTTWLHRIVVNACLDRVRHNAARPADPVAFDGSEVPGVTPSTMAVDDPAERTSMRLDLEQALATLPDEQRVPLVLVDVEGYPVADAAQMLDLPAGTVKSRCARARAKLLPLLAPGRSGTTGNQPGNDDVPSPTTHGPGGEQR
ncbi:RNA polymerase ECF family sigma subunit [Haloactinopolyspora alba]|uniref:RNA polymerase ECF family sigma subunit n=1 Tax=Haloactinopolyspora alba TaxID=648780 RepID=A0A2P8DVU1_9ACTN|nr:RNA polymerase sigma factor SigM [Haloactinopolyspora alba]PSL01353.1 RNA polymerase ECF family sigma subunit [Haloactinopolyspora alba]